MNSPLLHQEPSVVNAGVEIIPVSSLEGFDRCVELQIEVWGYSDGDVIPRRVFLVAQRIGGQVLGAMVNDRMVGFAMGLPGYRDGQSYLHSHMLAVLPEFRNAGLGRRLKLAQREDALARGFELMEWTFDPLEIKNAYLNLHKLGAICRRYQPDFYGPSSSPLQGGLPTDRLYAEWWLNSDRVVNALAGTPVAVESGVRVEVSSAIYEWKKSEADRERALALQSSVREKLLAGFDQGLAATDYDRDEQGNGAYLMSPWRDERRSS